MVFSIITLNFGRDTWDEENGYLNIPLAMLTSFQLSLAKLLFFHNTGQLRLKMKYYFPGDPI